MDFDFKGINKIILDKISAESNLGVSLKKSVQRVSEEDLLKELVKVREFYIKNTELKNASFDHRIKALHSSLLKYQKYYPNTEFKKCFNDLLGIRLIVDNYNDILNQNLDLFKVADMTNGKVNDDGYRGIHLYYQKTNKHYPIEIQINSKKDRIFNEWLHRYLYKYSKNSSLGKDLRELYDNGKIKNIEDFKEELENVLPSSKKI